jgi:hypothetical protein
MLIAGSGVGDLVLRGGARPIVVYRFDEVGKPVRDFGAHAGEQVLVGLNRGRRVGVRQTRTHDDPGEQLADRFRVQRFASSVREHRVARPNAVPVVALPITTSCEDAFGVGVEFEPPSTGAGLGGELGGSPGEFD